MQEALLCLWVLGAPWAPLLPHFPLLVLMAGENWCVFVPRGGCMSQGTAVVLLSSSLECWRNHGATSLAAGIPTSRISGNYPGSCQQKTQQIEITGPLFSGREGEQRHPAPQLALKWDLFRIFQPLACAPPTPDLKTEHTLQLRV